MRIVSRLLAILGVVLSALLLLIVAPARADTNWYYRVTGYAGSVKAGPFSSRTQCEQYAQAQRASGYAVAPCFSEGSQSGSGDGQRQQEEQQREEAERQRKLEEARRQEILRKQEAERRWEEEKAVMLKSLKGVAPGDPQLKGVGGNTPFFGLKGVEPKDSGLKPVQPAGVSPSLLTAWKELRCAAVIAEASIGHGESATTPADVQEIHYLAGQAMTALNGGKLEVACDPQAPNPTFHLASLPPRITVIYQAMFAIVEKKAEVLVLTRQQHPLARAKTEAARKQVEALNQESKKSGAAPAAVVTPDVKEQRRSAMAAALAALKKAETSEAQLTATEADAQLHLAEARKINDKLAAHPENADDLFKQIMGESSERKP